MVDVKSLFKRPTFGLKLAELILTIVCAAILGNKGPALTIAGVHVVYVAFHGYIAINIISILSYVMETHLHKYINVIIAVSGAAMFFASGGIMIDVYNTLFKIPDYLVSGGAVAIVTGIFYVADAALSFMETGAST